MLRRLDPSDHGRNRGFRRSVHIPHLCAGFGKAFGKVGPQGFAACKGLLACGFPCHPEFTSSRQADGVACITVMPCSSMTLPKATWIKDCFAGNDDGSGPRRQRQPQLEHLQPEGSGSVAQNHVFGSSQRGSRFKESRQFTTAWWVISTPFGCSEEDWE